MLHVFGSYGWGDGEWMREWVSAVEEAGAVVVGGEGVIACGAPDEEAEDALKELAKNIVDAEQ